MLETFKKFKSISVKNDKLYELTPADIKSIQTLLLEVIQDVDYVCKKYGLRYCLCGGSSLGAVRHKGFIPWDEDFDISMPRKDYDRFQEKFEAELGDKYWVQNIRTSKAYDLSFMKVRVKNTRYVEVFDSEEEKAGVFLDIFPLENAYDSPVKRKIHGIVCDAFLFICSCVRIRGKKGKIYYYFGKENVGRAVGIKAFIGFFFSFLSLHRWLLITEKVLSLCKDENSKDYTIPSGRAHYFGEIYSKASFFPAKEVPFENIRVLIQNNPDEYLSTLYGDYMQIPPENKREKHTVAEFSIGGRRSR